MEIILILSKEDDTDLKVVANYGKIGLLSYTHNTSNMIGAISLSYKEAKIIAETLISITGKSQINPMG